MRRAAHGSQPREDVQAYRAQEFAQVLAQLKVRPAVESLHPFSHWITPEVESRRFDTKFFATRLPVGQDLAGLTDEHQAIGWFRPEQTSGLPMLPPTAAVLAELATFGTVEQALAPQRQPVPIMPRRSRWMTRNWASTGCWSTATPGSRCDQFRGDARQSRPMEGRSFQRRDVRSRG